MGIFFSLENNNNKKKKKPIAERVQKSHYLRVVHELGVAVAGGDCHVVKVVKVSKSPNSRFLLWGRKLAQKENKIAKKRTNGKTLNPRRRAFVKKREKERGQESSLKQYKKKKKGVLYAVW